MKTSTVEVGELVSTLSAAGVQRQLSTLPGVHHADVNYGAGSATVHYDEAKISLDDIRQRVVDCGYHCRGELAPAHVCDPAGHTTTGHDHARHAGHAMPGGAGGTDATDGSVDSKAEEPPTPAKDVHAGHGAHTTHKAQEAFVNQRLGVQQGGRLMNTQPGAGDLQQFGIQPRVGLVGGAVVTRMGLLQQRQGQIFRHDRSLARRCAGAGPGPA